MDKYFIVLFAVLILADRLGFLNFTHDLLMTCSIHFERGVRGLATAAALRIDSFNARHGAFEPCLEPCELRLELEAELRPPARPPLRPLLAPSTPAAAAAATAAATAAPPHAPPGPAAQDAQAQAFLEALGWVRGHTVIRASAAVPINVTVTEALLELLASHRSSLAAASHAPSHSEEGLSDARAGQAQPADACSAGTPPKQPQPPLLPLSPLAPPPLSPDCRSPGSSLVPEALPLRRRPVGSLAGKRRAPFVFHNETGCPLTFRLAYAQGGSPRAGGAAGGGGRRPAVDRRVGAHRSRSFGWSDGDPGGDAASGDGGGGGAARGALVHVTFDRDFAAVADLPLGRLGTKPCSTVRLVGSPAAGAGATAASPRLPLVWDVSLSRGQRHVTLRSAVAVENNTGRPLELAIADKPAGAGSIEASGTDSTGGTSGISGSFSWKHLLGAGEAVSIPLWCADTHDLYARPQP